MRTALRAVGYLAMAVGLVGLISPTALGMHVGGLHNLIHVGAGLGAVYFGTSRDDRAARRFALALGGLYAAMGAAGLALGRPGTPFSVVGTVDPRLLSLWPGRLEFGTVDHVFHLLSGLWLLVSSRPRRDSALVKARETRTREAAGV